MRKITLVVAMLGLAFSGTKAQSFENTLKTSFDRFDTATSIPAITSAIAQLDMIEQKNATNWASHFYAAYARIKVSLKLSDKDQRDRYLDTADVSLIKAAKLFPNNEEILVLQAYGAKARIAADPKERWKKYGDIYFDFISKAKKINPNNPRIYFLDGMEPFWKPKIWGSGKNKAKPYFQKAKELFSKENKSDILKPYWGQQANEGFLDQCDE